MVSTSSLPHVASVCSAAHSGGRAATEASQALGPPARRDECSSNYDAPRRVQHPCPTASGCAQMVRWSNACCSCAESLPDAATISDITTMLRASARQLHYEHGDTLRESTPAWLLETLNIGMDAETLSEAGWADILAWALRETVRFGGGENMQVGATRQHKPSVSAVAAARRRTPFTCATDEQCGSRVLCPRGRRRASARLGRPVAGASSARPLHLASGAPHDRYALASDRLARAGAPAHFLRPSRDPRGGVYGCFDSHVRCLVDYAEEWRAAGVNANAKTPRALFVLEDDAEFAEGYEAALKAVTHFIDTVPPDSYDLIFLTAKARVVMKSMGNGISMGAGVLLGACGYLASPAFCERVAQLAPQAEGLHVDYWLNTVARKDHIFVLDQAITFQRNKDSDNTLAGVGTIKTGNPTAIPSDSVRTASVTRHRHQIGDRASAATTTNSSARWRDILPAESSNASSNTESRNPSRSSRQSGSFAWRERLAASCRRRGGARSQNRS